jgi:hypothetical protein
LQGGAEVDGVQAADGGGPGGLGQDLDGRAQGDQIDEVQDGGEPFAPHLGCESNQNWHICARDRTRRPSIGSEIFGGMGLVMLHVL